MTELELKKLLEKLVEHSNENELIEFKLNYHSAEEIGETISAISNASCLQEQPFGYLVFGVKDNSHLIEGTTPAKGY